MNLNIQNLSKAFDGRPVLTNLSMKLESGHIYCLMSPSGSGKTTLLRILLGLETADSGQIHGLEQAPMAAVFQEDRLCEGFTPLENVLLTASRHITPDTAKSELCKLLPSESLTRPVFTLSGGMKRRTAICRAMLADSELILMDEPFTGLDDQTKRHVIDYIKQKSTNKLVLLTTHQEEDIALLNGIRLSLNQN